jgi:tetratricopeptide (TPR) repeat protein
LQAGDFRRARSEYAALLKRAPTFYPAEAALGYVELASRHPREALDRFDAALSRDDRYLAAWLGRAEAYLALDRDADAIDAMERVLALDPRREAVQGRLQLVQFRLVQSLIATGRQAREAGRLDQARQTFEQALSRSPSSALILHELVLVERAAGRPAEAEEFARRAVRADPDDAEAHATLAALLADRSSFADAAAAYERAHALDAREEWRAAAADLRAKAKAAALPPEFASIPTADRVTRAQVAALIGVRLESLIARAPSRVSEIATDVRRHWAAPWILPVTRAGVMPVFPNHTFQPSATVSRAALAGVVAELLRLAMSTRAGELAKWQAARPRFPDLPLAHINYRAAALAITAEAMTTNARGEFDPTDAASGADLDNAVRRIERLLSR